MWSPLGSDWLAKLIESRIEKGKPLRAQTADVHR